MIETKAYARAGLLGNPSDGYNGKIVAVTLKNFCARVSLEASTVLCIVPGKADQNRFADIHDLARRVKLHGYYGGGRLVKAGMATFYRYCDENGIALEGDNFTIRYSSSIPRQVGLAGSSAIITAVMRALMAHFAVDIPKTVLPGLILAAERDELGINAGLMDRVVQVYEGCVYMDLSKEIMDAKGHGLYEPVELSLLPKMYIAYKPALGKVSGQVLNTIRQGFDRGDAHVLETLEQLAALAADGRKALQDRDWPLFHKLMNGNFDLRSKIMSITEGNRELVETARACGASAKFAGSGGTIIGLYHDIATFDSLEERLSKLKATVVKTIL